MRCVCLRRTGSSPVSRTSSVTLHPIRDHHICGGRELFFPRWHSIYFVVQTHVVAKFALRPRLFLPAAQKDAGRVAPLLLLPAKSLVCSGCSLASAVATPPLHYQLFADKGKGFFYVSLALIVRVYISILTQKSADTARCLPFFTSSLFTLHYSLFTAPVGPGSAHPLPPPASKPRRYSCPHRRGRGI